MGIIGSVNRALPLLLGAALLLSTSLPPMKGILSNWGVRQYALPAIGVILISTAIFRICPACELFAVRTCDSGRR